MDVAGGDVAAHAVVDQALEREQGNLARLRDGDESPPQIVRRDADAGLIGDDLERDMERDAEKLEARAEKLEKKAEKIEQMVDELDELAYEMRREIPELDELGWF